jgi:hypothetical protein
MRPKTAIWMAGFVNAAVTLETARQCQRRRRCPVPGDQLLARLGREAIEIGLVGRIRPEDLEAVGAVGDIGA